MRYLIYFVLGYGILYGAVWLHEAGHALMEYRFGAKDAWWKVQVKPYIFFSTPGPVDEERWNALTDRQYVLVAYGGILANGVWAALTGLLLWLLPLGDGYLSYGMWLFLTIHLGEIVSYLFIGNLYLVSDMKMVHAYMPRLRIPGMIAGALITVLYLYLLTRVPAPFRIFVAVWNGITVASMCLGRILFSLRAARAAAGD